VELVFNLAAPFRQRLPDGRTITQPLHMVVGPASGPTVITPSGAVDIIGVRLQPWSVSVLGVHAAELRDRCVPLHEVAPALAERCANALAGTSGCGVRGVGGRDDDTRNPGHGTRSSDDRVALLLDAFAVATEGYEPDGRLAAVVARCDAGGDWPGMAAVAREHGFNVRALERLFATHVGLAPKTLVQILRVQRAIAEVRRNPHRTWAAVAASAGYVDQSHLVREMRRFAGMVPTALEDEGRRLTQVFLAPVPTARTSARSRVGSAKD
jgi:AraC-like DNA-binding protein